MSMYYEPSSDKMLPTNPIPGPEAFEGAADEVAGEPQHGDSGTCAVCGGEIEFYRDSVYTVGGEEETLTTWWAHRVHPADGHDAVLGGPA